MRCRSTIALLMTLLIIAPAPALRAQSDGIDNYAGPYALSALQFKLAINAQVGAIIQSASGQSSPQNGAGNSAIEGTVVNAQTGEPVRKADVTAIWSGRRNTDNSGVDPQSASSDASGHFAINGLPAGKYRLRVEANRFAAQSYGSSRFGGRGKDIDVAAGQRVTGIDVRLMPCGIITGEVHDESGDPVEGAMVQAVPVGRRRGFQGGNQVQTNDLGQYRLYNLAPGQYVVQVSVSRPEEQQQQAAQQAYVPLFYPGVTDPASASTITVDSGTETQGIDVDVRPVHAVRVSGRVVNASGGRNTQNAYVMLMPAGLDPHKRMGAVAMLTASRYGGNVSGPRGEFEISGVPAGSYWATANLQDDQRQYQGRALVQVGDADVQDVTISVSAGVNLMGHVRVDPQRPFDYSKLAVAAIPADGMMGGEGVAVRPDGGFVFENLMAGNYRVTVSGFPEEYYLKSVSFGGGDVLDNGLSVDSNSGSAPLDVVLRAGGSTVSGTVMNDGKPAQATVFLVPDAPRRDRQDLYSIKVTQADGTFTLIGLPPGDFKLFAFEDPDSGLVNDPSLLQPYEAKGTSVSLEEGQKQTVQLELIPTQE